MHRFYHTHVPVKGISVLPPSVANPLTLDVPSIYFHRSAHKHTDKTHGNIL